MLTFIQFISEGSSGQKRLNRKRIAMGNPKKGPSRWTNDIGYRMAYKSGSSILRKRAKQNQSVSETTQDTDQFWDKISLDHKRKIRRDAQKQLKQTRKYGGYPEKRNPKSITKNNFRSGVFEGSSSPSRIIRRQRQD